MLDLLALSGLDLVYDRIESRFGKAAAWVVTMTLALAILATAVAILMVVI